MNSQGGWRGVVQHCCGWQADIQLAGNGIPELHSAQGVHAALREQIACANEWATNAAGPFTNMQAFAKKSLLTSMKGWSSARSAAMTSLIRLRSSASVPGASALAGPVCTMRCCWMVLAMKEAMACHRRIRPITHRAVITVSFNQQAECLLACAGVMPGSEWLRP